jgi:phosphohistidine phosphatase SixA
VAAAEVQARGASVMVVGHEPGMSSLGAQLVANPSFPGFRKGQVCVLEGGKLIETLDPDTL